MRPALRSAGRLRRDEQGRIGFQGRRARRAENTLALQLWQGAAVWPAGQSGKGFICRMLSSRRKVGPAAYYQVTLKVGFTLDASLEGVQRRSGRPVHCRHCKVPRLFARARTASAARRSSRSISTLNTAIRSARCGLSDTRTAKRQSRCRSRSCTSGLGGSLAFLLPRREPLRANTVPPARPAWNCRHAESRPSNRCGAG